MQFQGDEGFPDAGNTFGKLNQFAPRVGLAWDPRGDNVQTIRAAAGVYYDSPKLWQYGRHPLNAPFGNTIQVNQPASFNDPWAAYPGGNPFPTPLPPPSDIPFPTLGHLRDDAARSRADARDAVERQLSAAVRGELDGDRSSYLGNRTSNIWIGKELNPAVYIPGSSTQANQDARRVLTLLNPVQGAYYSTIQESFEGWGHYHGIVLGLQRRLSNGWSMNTNLTLSRCQQQRRARHRHHQRLSRSRRSEHQLGAVRRRSPVHPQQLVHLSVARARQRLRCAR